MDSITTATSPFEVILYPNPPLGRYAFVAVVGAVAVVSFVLGAGFALVGAWPVTGFFGIDVAILFWAMRKIRHDGRQFETIRLDADGLTVRKVAASGVAREWQFEPYWIQVEVQPRGPASACLAMRSHGRQVVVGSFLTVDECNRLAGELRRALENYRK